MRLRLEDSTTMTIYDPKTGNVYFVDQGNPMLSSKASRQAKRAGKQQVKQAKQQAKTQKKLRKVEARATKKEQKAQRKENRATSRTARASERQDKKLVRVQGKKAVIQKRAEKRIARQDSGLQKQLQKIQNTAQVDSYEPDFIPDSDYSQEMDIPGGESMFTPDSFYEEPDIESSGDYATETTDGQEYYDDEDQQELSAGPLGMLINKAANFIKSQAQQAPANIQKIAYTQADYARIKLENTQLKNQLQSMRTTSYIIGGASFLAGNLTGVLISKALKK